MAIAPASVLTGNAPEAMKAVTAFKWDNWLGGPAAPGYGRDIRQGLRFTELNLKEDVESSVGKSNDPGNGRVRRITETVHEMTVTEDCLNGMGFLHGGCTAYLIDTCSSITLTALDPPDYSIPPTVSLNLNVTYHAAASLGASLRIISTVVSFSTRVQTVRCEVWDVTNPTHRLVASGMHIKMRSGKEGDPKAQEWRKEVYGEDMWATNAQKAKL